MKANNDVRRTAILAGSIVGATALAAAVWWWIDRRRSDRALTGQRSGGNIITGAVQTVVDASRNLFGMQYFTINELTRSSTANKYGIDNTPTPEIRAKLEDLVVNCLDPIRRIYGKPIIVTSGYRSPELNSKVGGVVTSQHTKGEAADLQPASGGNLEGLAKAVITFGDFDQLILEQSGGSKWVHVSWRPNGRRRKILAYKNGQYTDVTNAWQSYLPNWA